MTLAYIVFFFLFAGDNAADSEESQTSLTQEKTKAEVLHTAFVVMRQNG